MKKRNLIYLAILLLCISSASCTSNVILFEKKEITITTAHEKRISLSVELATTQEQQRQGFMGRTSIPKGTGMLFVFPSDQILSFWMKNTPSPLSIAYIDSHGRIRDIFDLTPYSTASVSSSVSVRYALEVPQGWFKEMGITIGDTISGF